MYEKVAFYASGRGHQPGLGDLSNPGITDLPELEVVLINRPEVPPFGAGEGATIPPVAAIVNAIYDAVGVRLREGPFTPKRYWRN